MFSIHLFYVFFKSIFRNIVENFAQDSRCEVHQTLLGIREGKEGWFEIFCPGGISCDDNGELFSIMVFIIYILIKYFQFGLKLFVSKVTTLDQMLLQKETFPLEY